MNELKPEDVKRALELCANCECYDEERDIECPFVKMSFCKNYLRKQALAILLENDAEIERLERANNNLVREVKASHIRIDDLERDKEMYRKAVETAQKEFLDYQADVQMEIADARADAITQFEERLLRFYDNLSGKTASGSVTYHIRQIAKELRGGAE